MRGEAVIFLLAVQFLTRLPVPVGSLYTPERMAASVRYYPAVGALIGGLYAAVFWTAALIFTPAIALALAIAAGLLITGAFHEDGLADTFDGIGGGQDRAQALEIMKDSRLGTYGTLALVTALALKFLSLDAMPDLWVAAALIGGHAASRFSSVVVIATSSYARPSGTAKPVAEGISGPGFVIALLTGFASLGLAAMVLPVTALALGSGGLVLGHIAMRLLFERKLRGYTGDTLGAVQQVSEIGFYLGLLAWLP